MEQKIGSAGPCGRDVDEAEGVSPAFEQEPLRKVEAPVVVAKHAVKRASHRLDGVEGGQVTIIPKVPDFIGRTEFPRHRCGKIPVGIGEDGDSHAGCLLTESSRKKEICFRGPGVPQGRVVAEINVRAFKVREFGE